MIKMSKNLKTILGIKILDTELNNIFGIKKYGLTTMHRKNFKPIHKMLLK